ncbi:hypothetical protein ACJRO7_025266 [Eucalyptus globulus]|uniref:RNase H type-1 domain-containing protein n=1 Tax=Eucalyptus globulus TaxID=34317 RepID=A0ABD3K8C1_EUCGL
MDAWLADLICKKKAIPDLETLAHILWHLWKSQNLFVFRRAVPDPQQVILAAFASAQSARRSHEVWTCSSPNLLTSERLWKPPDPAEIKINIDGAFSSTSKEGSVASIWRDHSGRLINGSTQTVPATTALQVEAQAPTVTLHNLLQKKMERKQLTVESDYWVLVHALRNPCSMPWEARSLISEAAALIPCFSRLRIVFCRREANRVAH